MKIVVNRCFGGFSVSRAVVLRARELGAKWAQHPHTVLQGELWPDGDEEEHDWGYGRDAPRNDPILVQVVEELGEAADGMCSKLDITEIPDNVDWEIAEYDGAEHVAEKHRTW